MRVARQTLAIHFLAEAVKLFFGQAAFQEGPGVDAGRAVALDIEQVTTVAFALGMPEMVETRTKHAGHGCERTDVPAQVAAVGRVKAVGAHHHGHGVPAHVGAQALFDGDVAGAAGFLLGLDGVHIPRVARKRHVDAVLAGVFQQLLDQKMGALSTFLVDDRGQRVHPLTGFLLIGVGGGRGAVSGLGVGLS